MFFDDPRENEIRGVVFNIEKYHIHDGEGIRTNIFLKGCNLWCQWCCNPESQRLMPQVAIHQNLCKKCGFCCKKMCKYDAVHFDDAGLVRIDIEKCRVCGACIELCPHEARELYGIEMSVADVMRKVEKDKAYYDMSGGGITITGGEPCLHPEFTRELVLAAKKRNIHTAVETAGALGWEQLWTALEPVDAVLLDVKYTTQEKFATISAVPLESVKENLGKLRDRGKYVRLRCPVIPGKNDDMDHIRNIGLLAKENGITDIDILPFHQLGRYKYDSLRYSYSLSSTPEMDKKTAALYQKKLQKEGLHVTVGG